jgi:hypothetical protein
MMYMLISEICSNHVSHLYVLESAAHLDSRIICTHYYEKIIISNYSYNKICDEHTVDMLLTFEYN